MTAETRNRGWRAQFGTEAMGLGLALIAVVTAFSLLSPRFLSLATFDSVAFQLPELGLLTLLRALYVLAHFCH